VTLKRVSLELGGNNALIVLDDADVDVASSAGAWGAFLHQGQVCMTAGRHIVLDAVADEYLRRLTERAEKLPVGNPFTEQVALGPLINERQLANVDRIVTETVSAGATLRTGGTHERLYYQPTVLAGVTGDMPAFREEIFGPVAPVIVVSDVDEAVRVANDTEYGLVAAIQTGSVERGLDVAERLHTGIVHVNDPDAEQRCVRPLRRDRCLRERQPVRLAEQLGRVHPVAVGHRAATGARLPVLASHLLASHPLASHRGRSLTPAASRSTTSAMRAARRSGRRVVASI
jgi:acyl-CoA reductase-like NAD-dependent aldehyde dehydrogenase